MHKNQLFNAEICYTLAKLGHTDQIAIGDAGLPIPETCTRIDMALTSGVPSFLQVFDCIGQAMQIEKVILANELKQKNPMIYTEIMTRISQLEKSQKSQIIIDVVPHEQFKKQTVNCKAVIRTGECSPYANIILQSGVIF